jgi:hypothetical protein
MPALGQKQSLIMTPAMTALGREADAPVSIEDVRS